MSKESDTPESCLESEASRDTSLDRLTIPLDQLSAISFAAAADPVRWGYDHPDSVAFPAFFKLYPQCAEYLPEFQSRLERGQVKADTWPVGQSQSDMKFVEDVSRESIRRGYEDHSWVIQPYQVIPSRTGRDFLTAVVTIWKPNEDERSKRIVCISHQPLLLTPESSVPTPQRKATLTDAEQLELLADIPVLWDVYARFRKDGVIPASTIPEVIGFTGSFCKNNDYRKTKECLFRLLERTPTAAVVLANIGYVFFVDGKEHWADWYLQMARLFAPETPAWTLDNAIQDFQQRSQHSRKEKTRCYLPGPKRWWQYWKPSDGDLTNLMSNIDGDQIYVVQALLDHDPRLIHAQDGSYGTALHRAAIRGRTAIAEMLIVRGADVRARKKRHRHTPLHYAAQMGRLDIARLFISKGADINARDYEGMTPLDSAAYGGSIQAIEFLADQGARSGGSAIAHAINAFSQNQVVRYLEVVRCLLERGLPLTSWHGQSPLHLAASLGITEIADLLIHKGADVNAQDRYGRTPLHAAAGSRDEEAGEILERNCHHDVYDVIMLLVANGADVKAHDKHGKTPMDVAVGNRRLSAIYALDAHLDNVHWRSREEFLSKRQTRQAQVGDHASG